MGKFEIIGAAKIAGLLVCAIGLSGCMGSFKEVLTSNEKRKTEHMKFQVNRLNAISTCYANASTDALKHGCQLMQVQLQTEQGFTVQAGLDGLPETPENQIKDGLLETAKIAAGVKLGEAVINGLNRPNDVVKVPEIYEVDKPVFIPSTPSVSGAVVE